MNEDKRRESGLEQIGTYIENLKFKTALVGGVDKEEVYTALRDIYQLFGDAYEQSRTQGEMAGASRGGEEITRYKAELVEKNAELSEKDAELSEKNAELSEKNEEIIWLKSQAEGLEQQIQQVSTGEAAEQREKYWSEKVEALEAEMQKQQEKGVEREQALRRENGADAARYREEMTTLRKQTEARIAEQQEELEELKKALELLMKEHEQREREHEHELSLARTGAELRSETLEQIYLEAREHRTEMIERAKIDAEEILSQAREEEQSARSESIREAEEKYLQAQHELIEAQQRVEEVRSEEARLREETQLSVMSIHNEAKDKLVSAKEEARQIIDSARIVYQREYEKYNHQLLQLGNLRSQTVKGLQESVTKLNDLVFEMSSEGIRSDAENTAGLRMREDIEEEIVGAEAVETAGIYE